MSTIKVTDSAVTQMPDRTLGLQNDIVRTLMEALELHLPGEAAHAERVAVMAVAIGQKLGMGHDELVDLRRAAQLHDIGKLALDRYLLEQLDELTEDQWADVQNHTLLGVKLLTKLAFLGPTLPAIKHHHERWDGSGYPNGLSATEIPLMSRIIAVTEAFDFMVYMPRGKHLSEADALAELRMESGKQFDPDVVLAMHEIQHLIQPVGGWDA